jgi:hypothetical protein
MLEQGIEARARSLPVVCLRAMLAAVDQYDVFRSDAIAREFPQPLLHIIRQRGGPHVEAELDRG